MGLVQRGSGGRIGACDGLRQPARALARGRCVLAFLARRCKPNNVDVDAVASGAMWSLRGTVLNCTVARRSVLVVLLI
jgi:hypothetical protein